MSESTHRRVARQVAEKLLSDPDRAWAVGQGTKFRTEHTDDTFTDIVGQPWRNRWDVGQDHSLALVAAQWNSGKLALVRFDVGDTPGRDLECEANQRALDSLRTVTEVTVRAEVDMDQYAGDCDGRFYWDTPLEMSLAIPGALTEYIAVTCESGHAALEIGHTDASKRWEHTIAFSGVARWPYGHEGLTLLLPLHQIEYAYPIVDGMPKKDERHIPEWRHAIDVPADPWPTVPRDPQMGKEIRRLYGEIRQERRLRDMADEEEEAPEDLP